MSGSGSQFWSILTEFACTMQHFEKKSKSNRPIAPSVHFLQCKINIFMIFFHIVQTRTLAHLQEFGLYNHLEY